MAIFPVAIEWAIGGAFAIWLIWKFSSSEAMRDQFNRAVFRIGYLLYTKTRVGKWINERNIRKSRSQFGDEGHTQTVSFSYGNLKIWAIPFLFDNYAYVVVDTATNDVVVVDAGDGPTVSQFLHKNSIVPKAVLTTHKHWDHCDGNVFLKKQYSSLQVYGSSVDSPYGVTNFPIHGESFHIGSLEFIALDTPGHTRGHVIYLLKGKDHGADCDCLFTGDLLFLAGSGKLFEGTADEMLNSLDLVCDLPDSTLIWPGHEYAVPDLLFSYLQDPENVSVQEKLSWARQQRQDRLPTCPSTLAEEKLYNLFLRCGDVDLLRKLRIASADEASAMDSSEDSTVAKMVVEDKWRVEALTKLREMKDRQI